MKRGLVKVLSMILAVSMTVTSIAVPTYAGDEIPYSNAAIEMLADQIAITNSGGWFESTYVEWSDFNAAAKYMVYVRKSTESSYGDAIDDELIRKYPTYWRADAPGLAAGNYVMKVVAYDDGGKIIAEKETDVIQVSAYDRSGFAFSSKSPNKTASGAYNDDGTLKKDAIVLYVTKDTAKTVTADVTKGKTTGTYTGLQSIFDAREAAKDTTPIDVRIIGKVSLSDLDHISSSEEGLQIKSNSNITIEGIGEDATIHGFGVFCRNINNFEMRNFAVMNCLDDSISIDTDNINVWVHNLDLFYGKSGSASDQAKGDGTVDMKGDSKYITVAYNHFYDSGKCSLCGMKSESGPNYITYSHNWFDHSDSRHPRIRTMSVHIYNNYFDGNSKYGVGAAYESSAFVENNVFEDCKHPMLSSLQGSDIMENDKTGEADFSAKGTFSKENGGIIKAYNNIISGSDANKYSNSTETEREPVYYDATDTRTNGASTQFDAYLVKSRDEEVPNTVKALVGGTTYDNVSLSTSNVNATPDDVNTVKATVTKYAGRVNGGDFPEDRTKYTGLTDASSDDVDTALKSDIVNYKSELVSVGGGSVNGEAEKPSDGTTEESTEKTSENVSEESSENTTEDESQALRGDVNQDGKVDGNDAAEVLKAVLDGSAVEFTGEKFDRYNLDGDNVISARDAAEIIRIYGGGSAEPASESTSESASESTSETSADAAVSMDKDYTFNNTSLSSNSGSMDNGALEYKLNGRENNSAKLKELTHYIKFTVDRNCQMTVTLDPAKSSHGITVKKVNNDTETDYETKAGENGDLAFSLSAGTYKIYSGTIGSNSYVSKIRFTELQ